MSKKHPPVAWCKSGEQVTFETYDCYNNQIIKDNQPSDIIDEDLSNPATGPLFIEGAEVGDILKVSILDIKINKTAVMSTHPNYGVLGDHLAKAQSKIFTIENDHVIFNDKIQIPVNPMIGVIGTAPAEENIQTIVPDMHGGNMDCKRIVKGATVYLPVFAEGALLAMGDLHAVMGDGEIVICGMETDGAITVQVDVIKGISLPLPIVAEGEHIMTLASKKTLDEAGRQATINMHQILCGQLNMDANEAGMLLSLVGDLKICQVVDPLMTARMEFPISILDQYGYKLP